MTRQQSVCRRIGSAVAILGFGLTGMGTALLGATLPASLHLWRLSDQGGGLLLLASWSGSTAGALAANRPVRALPSIGLLLSAAALLCLSSNRPPLLLPLFFLFGLGLGLTMTATSALQSRSLESDAAEVALNRLNLAWAVGAVLAPALALRSLERLSALILFRGLAWAFAVTSLLLLLTYRPDASVYVSTSPGPPRSPLPLAPIAFCVFAAASVGLESAVGSWLSTYAERTSLGVGTAVSSAAAFWSGLLLSRAAHSLPPRHWVHGRTARACHLLAVGAGLALLLLAPGPLKTPSAGLLCGFGLGPLYPWVLSLALPHFRSTFVFVMAGIGSGVTPWLTGALSTWLHSLRLGLLSPALAFVLLLLSALRMRSAEARHSPVLRYDA